MSAHPGLAGRLRRLADGLLASGQTRLELLSVEVQEEKVRAVGLIFNTVLAALFVGFGTLFLAGFLTVWLWESHRLLALGASTLLFLGVGLGAATRAARLLNDGSRLFAGSLAELQRDREALASALDEPQK